MSKLDVKARMVVDEVELELAEALERYPPMNSHHEGYAVILEELEGLWEHIKIKPVYRDIMGMRKEAIQVAAMAIRFVLDTLPEAEEF